MRIDSSSIFLASSFCVAFSKSNQTDPIINCYEQKNELQINYSSDHKFYWSWWPMRILQAAAMLDRCVTSPFINCHLVRAQRKSVYWFLCKREKKKILIRLEQMKICCTLKTSSLSLAPRNIGHSIHLIWKIYPFVVTWIRFEIWFLLKFNDLVFF